MMMKNVVEKKVLFWFVAFFTYARWFRMKIIWIKFVWFFVIELFVGIYIFIWFEKSFFVETFFVRICFLILLSIFISIILSAIETVIFSFSTIIVVENVFVSIIFFFEIVVFQKLTILKWVDILSILFLFKWKRVFVVFV